MFVSPAVYQLLVVTVTSCVAVVPLPDAEQPSRLQRLKFNHPGLVVDLGVGLWAWPLPMDYDGDGDLDLVVSCPDTPYNGTYFFENPGTLSAADGPNPPPVFKPAVRIGPGRRNVQVSYADGTPRVTTPGREYRDFPSRQFADARRLPLPTDFHRGTVRANQWKYADYDGDGRLDLVIGIGDWSDYGWDDAFDERGQWTRGPLHGYVYLARNVGTNDAPRYDASQRLQADGRDVDVYGMPSPNLADFDGDLDLVCGEFVDRLTYFENVGSRREPRYRSGRFLTCRGQPLHVPLCMIVPVAIDWDGDGHVDLIVGQEDGRVMLVRHSGVVDDGLPQFEPPRFFQQQADDLKFGALATPVGFDWDDDGDDDLVCGNTAGEIGFIENLGGDPPQWAAPRLVVADGRPIRIQAGVSGSIQGPCERKWGYTTIGITDWDGDGLADILANSIWGKVVWYLNVGDRNAPRFVTGEPVEVAWPGETPKPRWVWWSPQGSELVTQWRTTPVAIDFDADGLTDLVMLDQEGYLVLFRRQRRGDSVVLLPPDRICLDEHGNPLRLATGTGGKSGRRKLCLADWDRDGRIDLLVNAGNVDFYQGQGWTDRGYVFRNRGALDSRRLAGHATSPTTVDWNRDGAPELVIGAEDGHFYYLPGPVQASP